MAIQEQLVLSKDSNGDVKLTQNSVNSFKSINSGAIVDTLVLKEGKVGIGTDTPAGKLEIEIPDGGNVTGLLIDNLDTTNNPISLNIHNDGTGNDIEIDHDGSNGNAIRIASHAGAGTGIYMNKTGQGDAVYIDNDNDQHALYITQDGVLASGKYGLYIYSSAVQVNSELVKVRQNNSSSTATVLEIDNNGKGHGLYLHQDGVLDANKHALYVQTNVAQVNSPLVRFQNQHASNTQTILNVWQSSASATGAAQEIDNDGTGHGIYLHQDGVLDANKHALYVYSNVEQTNASLVMLHQNDSNSTYPPLQIINYGKNSCIYIQQFTTGTQAALSVNHLAAGGTAAEINNDGTGTGLYLHQDGVLAGGQFGLNLDTNIAQVNSYLFRIRSSNASSTFPVALLQNNGSGTAFEFDNDGTGHGIYLHQDGDLASSKYALYIDNNGTPTDGSGRCIRLDGCTISSTKNPETDAEAGFIAVNVDGTQYAVPYYALS